MSKRRLDVLLVDRGLAESCEKAQALVMAGQVRINEQPAIKAGVLVHDDVSLAVDQPRRFVGRGGEKLDHALEAFGIGVSGIVAADIGSSTGGFTDCLLQRGASRVYAIDVGRNQLDYKLRRDRRVVVMEGVNARDMQDLPEPVKLATIDVSFISLRLILPTVARLLHPANMGVIALFKPQFEAGKAEVPRGGVITDPQLHSILIGRFVAWCTENGWRMQSMVSSPILGAEGNREFLFWLRPAR